MLQMYMVRKKQLYLLKGFTLIELLVAIAIMGVLAGVVLLVLNPVAQLQKANDARRKADLNAIQRALEVYYSDHGYYPPDTAPPNPSDYFIIDFGGAHVTFGQSWLPYMARIPNDPKGYQ